MNDVSVMPENAFGYVPTPALVAPIEFTVSRDDYEKMGGHMDCIVPIDKAVEENRGKQDDHLLNGQRTVANHVDNPWPVGKEPSS